ncbi:MAG TPA: GDSL-type esterase/lipase family protein [Pirellulales bacterium]|jgi:acyl-CoA thioesterase-1|nr:GDSL-type esterase/lipase family protein [Pirellulales bacterium]
MQWTFYIFGSGLAFFIGVGMILAGLAASFGGGRIWPRVSPVLIVVGTIVAVYSGTPLPIWFFAIAILLTIAALILPRIGPSVSQKAKHGLRVLVALAWLGGVAVELPYHFPPNVPPVDTRQLYLFGDSLAAGLKDDRTNNWPELLARAHDLNLVNYARAGATVASAVERARDASLGDGVVLLEIGGNDMLGTTSAQDFKANLRQLLELVCGPARQVVMFELPLLPLKNEFGRAQRELASEFQVLLIPKRFLIGIITGDGATVDSIHLSAKGHQQMTEPVWRVLAPAYAR